MSARKETAVSGNMAKCSKPYLTAVYEKIKNSNISYALVYMNIKNFRYFNTKYGQQGGDEILSLIFERLQSLLLEDEYASYLYADHFALLLHCEDIDNLVTDRMSQMIDSLYRIQDERIFRELFWSIGIFVITDPKVSFHEALNLANLSRKESLSLFKRNTSLEVYNGKYHRQYMDRMNLETDTANAYKNYEFVTYLQPKVELKSGRIVGAEALMRWFDKDGNNIPLYKFLPILNKNGYIALVDLDIFEQSCRMLSSRREQNKNVVPISFNISKTYFNDPSLLKDYIGIFERYHIPKDLIEIELMESISMNNTKHLKEIIAQFKDYGFSCSLDDFGNGYSSFNVLLNAELDFVKMDRQFFLHNLNGDTKLVIKTIIDLIHSLDMSVVAEGVEMQEHIDWLKECGCDRVQGYYYYKPMPMGEFEKLLDSQ